MRQNYETNWLKYNGCVESVQWSLYNYIDSRTKQKNSWLILGQYLPPVLCVGPQYRWTWAMDTCLLQQFSDTCTKVPCFPLVQLCSLTPSLPVTPCSCLFSKFYFEKFNAEPRLSACLCVCVSLASDSSDTVKKSSSSTLARWLPQIWECITC